MAGEISGVLRELCGILEKRATAQVDGSSGGYDGANVLEGNPDATKGGGSPAKSEQDNKSPRDSALQDDRPMKTQQDDGTKSVTYNDGMGASSSNETKTVDGFNSGNPDDELEGEYKDTDAGAQTSKMANNILRGLYSAMTRTAGSPKSAGALSADKVLQQLIRAELRKASQDAAPAPPSAEEVAAKWPTMSEEEKAALKAAEPALVEAAMAILAGAGGGGGEGAAPAEAEKMSSAQLAEYMYYKQAGAQAALQFIQQMQGGQNMQKAAAQQDAQQSYQMGRLAAERDLTKVASMQKQAGAQAAYVAQLQAQQVKQAQTQYVHPDRQPDPQQSYDGMLKLAADAGINPNVLHAMLTDMAKASKLNGGTPHPFVDRGHVKSAVDVAPLYPVLSGLLDEGTITSEEKEAILNYLAGVEDLSEDSLRQAMTGVGQPEAVLKRILAGDVQEHQRNTHKAESPMPAMPATQPSPAAEVTEETRGVSEGTVDPPIPGAVAGLPGADALNEMIVEAALRNTLKRISPTRYKDL